MLKLKFMYTINPHGISKILIGSNIHSPNQPDNPAFHLLQISCNFFQKFQPPENNNRRKLKAL